MIAFGSPWLLAALAVLPLVWLLLRARPPGPRAQIFPPIALLATLTPRRHDALLPPLWLLALRLLAVALLIIGLARPVLPGDRTKLEGSGTLLLVLDDGMMAASGWNARISASQALLDDADRAGRKVILLRTAASPQAEDETSEATDTPRPAASLRNTLEMARPAPWPVDRAAAAGRLQALAARTLGADAIGTVVYLADGVASTRLDSRDQNGADPAFAAALRRLGHVQEIRLPDADPMVLTQAPSHDGAVMAQLLAVPSATPRGVTLRAHGSDGGTLAISTVTIPADTGSVPVPVALPAALRNRVDRISVDGVASAAATLQLDEADRLRPVGLITSGASDTPLVGALFYLRRALAPTADLREGNVATLLAQPLSVLVAPDGTLADAATSRRVAAWVAAGGTLIRFAGPILAGAQQNEPADAPDDQDNPTLAPMPKPEVDPATALLAVPLLDGSRQLGGTMSWGKPQGLAPFAADSPFHGLTIPPDVTISRQVLARPAADLSTHSWARLTDGTPLVTHATIGKGDVVLFHVTASADWSSLPLSGLFVSMLDRLVDHANGVDMPADNAILAPVLTLDGNAVPGPPPPFARGLAADRFGREAPSPFHPPGLYGPAATRRALNAGDTIRVLQAAVPVGVVTDPALRRPDRPFGPALLTLALLLLLADAVIAIALRGGLTALTGRRRSRLTVVALLSASMMAALPAHAQDASQNAGQSGGQSAGQNSSQNPGTNTSQNMGENGARSMPATGSTPAASGAAASSSVPGAALETRLAYIITGNDEVDAVSREGLQGLSDYVNTRTSAMLGHPDGVRPGTDDLSFYPLLYWPVTPDAQISPAATAALTGFMAHGGMLLIDTQGADSGSAASGNSSDAGNAGAGFAGNAPGSAAALRRVTKGLPIPPLMPLDDKHVLAHTFYLLHAFPGRYAGQPVWVAREGEAENDDVSPVIIGSADWAHVWAVDSSGDTPFAAIPGGDDQRRMAYRFGVNAVIYSLTGNYKADQVHVPAILKRLGE